jgi:hypothetical protein
MVHGALRRDSGDGRRARVSRARATNGRAARGGVVYIFSPSTGKIYITAWTV